MPSRRATYLAILTILGLFTLALHSVVTADARELRPVAKVTVSAERSSSKASTSAPLVVTRTISGPVRVEAELDRTRIWRRGDGTVQVEVSISTPTVADGDMRSPTDLVVIVDRSGSMQGEKMHYARTALAEVIRHLGPDDRFGLVAYDTRADLLIPLSYATESTKDRWLRMVSTLDVRGNTNLSSGLDLGMDMLESHRRAGRPGRVLLLSDGLANTGDSSFSGLMRRARRAVRGEYVLSTVGIGADFDERLMTSLASAGTGAFYYLAKLEVLREFLAAELVTAAQTYATGVTLSFSAGPGVTVTSVMGLPFEQQGRETIVPLGSLYGNHTRQLWLTLKVPVGSRAEFDSGSVVLRYRRGDATHEQPAGALPRISCVETWDEFQAGVRPEVWERAVLSEALNRVQERMGDAIASGSSQDLDDALADARSNQRLAQSLKRQNVIDRLLQLESNAEVVRQAQRAAPAIRSQEAKRQKTMGYTGRNRSAYVNSNPDHGY